MELLIGMIVAIIVIGVCIWGIRKLIPAFGIPEPWATVIWVIAVIIAVFAFLQISGLYHFNLSR
jgi:hypothetical protein